jgi:glycosyltransferase involved in cell wall biosynthesis
MSSAASLSLFALIFSLILFVFFTAVDRHFRALAVKKAFKKWQSSKARSLSQDVDLGIFKLPSGTIELFRSMDAKSDDSWVDFMNAWAAKRSLPSISLVPGDMTRFQRIKFERLEPVHSPCIVTVIIPCFNAEKTVQNAVESILAQTWRSLDVIAINDASSDRTGEILEMLSRKDARLKVLHNCINVGPYVSKNRAVIEARGKYITGHDSDDIAVPDRIENQMAPILSNPECKATIGYMIRIDDEGKAFDVSRIGRRSFDGVAKLAYISLLIEAHMLKENLGFWDSVRFAADSEMISRIEHLHPKNLCFVQKILMLCLSSPDSLTGISSRKKGFFFLNANDRVNYKNSYKRWHKIATTDALRLEFPLKSRPFSIPEKMTVPYNAVEQVLAGEVDIKMNTDL